MKADCGLVTTSILHRVKIKEEAKEYQQTGLASNSTSIVTLTTNSMSYPNILTAANATATVPTTNGLAVSASVTAVISTATCTTASNTCPTTRPSLNPLNLPTTTTCTHSQSVTSADSAKNSKAENRSVEEDSGPEAQRNCEAEVESELKLNAKGNQSDSSPSQKQWINTPVSTNSQSNFSRSEHKEPVGLPVPSDEDSPAVTQSVKPEQEDENAVANGPKEQANDVGPLTNGTLAEPTSSGGTNNAISNSECATDSRASSKCIAGIFASHTKLKRLLGTLVQFANDISTDTGDTVRSLVLTLLSGGMTAEEFHSALQEATNFPLRGFVLHYLKHTLPNLQKDLGAAARGSNQNCTQFLRANENMVLEAIGLISSTEPIEIFGEYIGITGVTNNNADGNGKSSGNGVGNGGGNRCSPHYGLRSNPGVGGIQQPNNSSSALQHYSSSPHPPKRRASDTPHYENGNVSEDTSPYGKRHIGSWLHHHTQQPQSSSEGSPAYCWYHPFPSTGSTIPGHAQGQSQGSNQVHGASHGHGHELGHSHGQTHGTPHAAAHGHSYGPSPMPPSLVQINQINTFSGSHHLSQQQLAPIQAHSSGSLDDEWKNIHVMLNCILGMVEKTKRALAILQRRGCPSPIVSAASSTLASNHGGSTGQNGTSTQSNAPSSIGTQAESPTGDREGNLKRLSGEIVAQTLRATEDRVAEVKRKAEEAVLEVKRAAVAEMQRAIAVAVAESRANERLRSHRLIDLPLSQRNQGVFRPSPFLRLQGNFAAVDTNIRSSTTPTTTSSAIASSTDEEKDVHLQTISGSSCWNCGRQALETCGGCGIARYCGSFCQHRDWEAGHHATCHNSPTTREPRRSASRSPPRISSANLSSSTNEGEVTGTGVVAGSPAGTVIKGK